MKLEFEQREKRIINGFLSMALGGAIEDKNRKMRKYIQKLFTKFEGTGEVNLKKKEAKDITAILTTVIDDIDSSPELDEGELPRISEEDYEACLAVREKLGMVC